MNIVELPTNTGQWSLVIHKVSTNSVELWAGTLFATLSMPKSARIIVRKGNDIVATEEINQGDWQRPFTRINQRFFVFRTVTNLPAAGQYQVEFYRKLDLQDQQDDWQLLSDGEFSTLPLTLPTTANKAFTVSLSSCFYNHRDGGRTANAFKSLYKRGNEQLKPDVKFMVGDQVYLDIGLDSLSPISKEIRQRIAEDYAIHWQALGSMLSRGGAWMLPDDHEYWNDYPFYDSWLPTLLMLKIPYVRNAWRSTARDGINNVQRCAKIDTFKLGDDLSFCIADLRSFRSKGQFIDKEGFSQLLDWANTLATPGVLVIPQILIVEKNELERNLLSFKKQYADLLKALASTGHDIVVMSGDVHFGRIAQTTLGASGGRLIEVVSSPMSNLTGANSIASSTAKSKPTEFPDPKAIKISGLTPQAVSYSDEFNVSGKEGHIGSSYWKERTREHFMTVSFHKSNAKVHMSVEAWRIRDYDDNQRLPKKDFKQAFEVELT